MILNYNQAMTANFKITFPKIPELEFYATSVNIPTVTLSPIEVNWQNVRAKVPDNKFVWDDLTVQFILDENLHVYEILKDWNEDARNIEHWLDALKDINIIPLDSNKIIEYSFLFEGAWPNMISGWQYTHGSNVSDYIVFDCIFSYQNFKIVRQKPLDFRIINNP